jgi:N-acetyl-anhydromuramyl-L-alanine amidase AmpD
MFSHHATIAARFRPIALASLALSFAPSTGHTHGPQAVVASSPVLAMTSKAASCQKKPAKQVTSSTRSCSAGGKTSACAGFDPPKSDGCAAQANRSAGVDVRYDYFGNVDCRSSDRKRAVDMVVIHNGDSARGNDSNWQCRTSAAHYTIDRDGQIYQHIGEERAAWHAGAVNDRSIGIELQIRRKYGHSCNQLSGSTLAKIATREGLDPEDVVAEMCGPTPAQYQSLRKLLKDIASRHEVAPENIVGHCEVVGPSGHADPRAFDWEAIGLSNAQKRTKVAAGKNACSMYHFAAVKARVVLVRSASSGQTRIVLNRGSNSGIEVGDSGYLADEQENVASGGRFEIASVTDRESVAFVSIAPDQLKAYRHATITANPGSSPKRVSKSAEKTSSAASGAPRLGSCEPSGSFTYWKGGRVASYTQATDGTIDTLTLSNVGWNNRVCDDARGMIYVGNADDAFIQDKAGENIRFQMVEVGASASKARITHGTLMPDMLKQGRRVVVRAKKK